MSSFSVLRGFPSRWYDLGTTVDEGKAWVYNYKRDFTVFQVEPTIFSANFCFVFKDACVYIYIQQLSSFRAHTLSLIDLTVVLAIFNTLF